MDYWEIRGPVEFITTMPGSMHPSEIVRVLQRLAARHLSQEEVVAASLRKNFRGYAPHLEQIGRGLPLHVEGGGSVYVARVCRRGSLG